MVITSVLGTCVRTSSDLSRPGRRGHTLNAPSPYALSRGSSGWDDRTNGMKHRRAAGLMPAVFPPASSRRLVTVIVATTQTQNACRDDPKEGHGRATETAPGS